MAYADLQAQPYWLDGVAKISLRLPQPVTNFKAMGVEVGADSLWLC
jgi:hypothetical protein